MTDSAPVTPRTEAGRELLANLEPRFANLPWDQVSYDLTLEEVLAIEREAAAPAATEALRAALEKAEHWWISGYPADSDLANDAFAAVRAALASPEPTPDSGLDVERLRQAMILAGWPADGSTATSSIIAAEYARLSEENA